MDEGSATAYQEARSVLEFGPDRLGHALLLPPSLQDLLKEKKIPVESCPTSNVMTLELAKHCSGSLLEGLRQHPQLLMWLETKHPISIGTDDPGVFDTNPTKELMLLQKTFCVPKATLKRILLESMDHAFCNDETRRQIQTQMLGRLM
jgi:adenosine deaminase